MTDWNVQNAKSRFMVNSNPDNQNDKSYSYSSQPLYNRPLNHINSITLLNMNPVEIAFKGSLEEAVQCAKADNKWLLINIENNESFSNLWLDCRICELVKDSFVLVQLNYNSADGQNVAQWCSYDCNFGYVAILNPLSGECKMSMKEPEISVNKVLDQLYNFLKLNDTQSHNSCTNGYDSNGFQRKRKRTIDVDSSSDNLDQSPTPFHRCKRYKTTPSSITNQYPSQLTDDSDQTPIIFHEPALIAADNNNNSQIETASVDESNSKHVLRLLLKLPDNTRDCFSIGQCCKMKDLFEYLNDKGWSMFKYDLILLYPKRVIKWSQNQMTLMECQIDDRETIFIQDSKF